MRLVNLLKDFPDGYQFGELFGHGIVVEDFNGDGLGSIFYLNSYAKGILLTKTSLIQMTLWSRHHAGVD